jgi:hypothetical protein
MFKDCTTLRTTISMLRQRKEDSSFRKSSVTMECWSGKRICSKSEYGVRFFASPVLSIGVAIKYSFVLCSVTAFWWHEEVAPSDWTLIVLPALPRLRAVHRVAISFAALNKQTNKHTGCFRSMCLFVCLFRLRT